MPAHDDGVVDWRRLASDRNVSLDVARGLWERARAGTVDARHAERAYNQMLDAAATANATHEPGRGTLVASRGVADAASLGPGKSTLVLNERSLPTAPRPNTVNFDDAIEAGKRAVELLAKTSPEDIASALRALAPNSELVQRALGVAARLVKNRDDFVAKQPPPPKKKKKPEDEDGDQPLEEEPVTEDKGKL